MLLLRIVDKVGIILTLLGKVATHVGIVLRNHGRHPNKKCLKQDKSGEYGRKDTVMWR
jgi:hypothetical protein